MDYPNVVMNLIKKFLIIYFTAALIIIGLYASPGFFFETGSDVYVNLIQRGTFTAYGEGVLNNYGIYIFLTHWFAKLQALLPQFNSLYVFILISFILITANLMYFSLHNLKGWNVFAKFILAFCLMLMGVHCLYSVETARTSMLLTGSSSLILFLLWRENKLTTLNYLFFFGMSVLGLLIRIESAILILALVLPVGFFLSHRKIAYLKITFPYAIVVLILSHFLNTPLSDADKGYSALRPYQFGLWDYQLNDIDLDELSTRDAIIYETASNFFIADPKHINPTFFERIGIEQADKTLAGILRLFKHTKPSKIYSFYQSNKAQILPLFIVYGSLILYLLIFSSRPLTVLYITIYAMSIILVVACLMKMELRIFHPILFLAILLICASVRIRFPEKKPLRAVAITLSVALLVLITGASAYSTQNYLNQKTKLASEMNVLQSHIDELEDNSLVIVNLQVFTNWEQKLSVATSKNTTTNLVVLDNFLLFLQASQQKKLYDISACSDYFCFMNYLIELKDKNIILVSSSARKDMFDQYIAELYQVDMVYQHLYSSSADNVMRFDFSINEIHFKTK